MTCVLDPLPLVRRPASKPVTPCGVVNRVPAAAGTPRVTQAPDGVFRLPRPGLTGTCPVDERPTSTPGSGIPDA